MVAGLERALGLAAGLLGLLEVDLAGHVGRLGHDHDLVGPDLEEPADDGERLLRATLADAQLADAERRDERRVVGQDAELALRPGQLDRVDRVRVGQPLGRDDLELVRRAAASAGRQPLGVLADVLDGAGEEEGLLRQRVGLALEDLLERRDRVLDRHVGARSAGEDLGHEERLAREALQPPRPGDGRLVVLGQLVDAEDRDDVLQVAVALQDALGLLGDLVVLLADDVRVEDARGRGQRVDRRVDAELGDRALEADRRVEVGERRRRRRVGVVVGRARRPPGAR